jgi:hypothetical protein
MLRVLKGLQLGEPPASMIEYLVGIEIHHMGLSLTSETRPRAQATVTAISERLGRK